MSTYEKIYEYYENCFAEHGDTPEGLAWQNQESMDKRFKVMCQLHESAEHLWDKCLTPHILDLGCGTGHFLRYIHQTKKHLVYEGMDISSKFTDFCQATYTQEEYPELLGFSQRDVIKNPLPKGYCSFAVMNGILTVKDKLSFDEMWGFTKELIQAVWNSVDYGLAFNVMSKQVDWERDDLFHLPLDTLANYLTKHISRHFIIRNDYGLYEYTVFVYKQPL